MSKAFLNTEISIDDVKIERWVASRADVKIDDNRGIKDLTDDEAWKLFEVLRVYLAAYNIKEPKD